tara:strand:+ start:40 stop:519 length:480 start_codon:yes stop_codon:yes gene_type:complete
VTDVLIRPARSEDVDAAAQAGYSAWLKGMGPIVPEETRLLIGEESFASFISRVPEQILIAERAGQIAGMGATEDGDNYISDIWVAPKHEGHGIGRALVRALEARIVARGYKVAAISVLSENARALSLYRHLGYTLVSEGIEYREHLRCELATTKLEKTL